MATRGARRVRGASATFERTLRKQDKRVIRVMSGTAVSRRPMEHTIYPRMLRLINEPS